MEKKNHEDSASIINVASEGDVILVVGPEKRRLRVHSLILKNSSRVFKAMFGPHFKEGQDLSAVRPKEIPMPEDDADALTLICSVIHSRNDVVPQSLLPNKILRVAVAADKYDCVVALKFAFETWLKYKDIEDTVEIGRFMAAAYIFGSAYGFLETTLALIFRHEGSYLQLIDEDACEAIPPTIFCLLEERRSMIRTELEQILLEVSTSPGYGRRHCSCAASQAISYIELLREKGLWPAKIVNVSISCAITKAEEIINLISPRHHTLCSDSNWHETSAPNNQKERLRHGLDRIKNTGGLCIDCVRSKRTVGTEECQIKH